MYGRTILLMASLALPLIAAPLSGNTHLTSADIIKRRHEVVISAILGDVIKRLSPVETLPLKNRSNDVAESKRDTPVDENKNDDEDEDEHVRESDDLDDLGDGNNLEVRDGSTNSLEDRNFVDENDNKNKRAHSVPGNDQEARGEQFSESGQRDKRGLNPTSNCRRGLNPTSRCRRGLNPTSNCRRGLNPTSNCRRGLNPTSNCRRGLNPTSNCRRGLNPTSNC